MPERVRVGKHLAEDILGKHISWTFDVAKPEGAQEALDEADARYVAVVETVNWSRILQEAFFRCRAADHPFPEDEWDHVHVPCAICLRDELLVENSWQRGGWT